MFLQRFKASIKLYQLYPRILKGLILAFHLSNIFYTIFSSYLPLLVKLPNVIIVHYISTGVPCLVQSTRFNYHNGIQEKERNERIYISLEAYPYPYFREEIDFSFINRSEIYINHVKDFIYDTIICFASEND